MILLSVQAFLAPGPEWAKLEEFGSNWKLIEDNGLFLLQIARCHSADTIPAQQFRGATVVSCWPG